MKLSKVLHKVVLLRPLLKLFGVKDKTVAAKVGEGLTVIDGAVNEKRGDAGIVIIELLIICILIAPVAIALLS